MLTPLPRRLVVALLAAGLVGLGLSVYAEVYRAEWLDAHPILTNLASGVVAFCFGVPAVSGVIGKLVAGAVRRGEDRQVEVRVMRLMSCIRQYLPRAVDESSQDDLDAAMCEFVDESVSMVYVGRMSERADIDIWLDRLELWVDIVERECIPTPTQIRQAEADTQSPGQIAYGRLHVEKIREAIQRARHDLSSANLCYALDRCAWLAAWATRSLHVELLFGDLRSVHHRASRVGR